MAGSFIDLTSDEEEECTSSQPSSAVHCPPADAAVPARDAPEALGASSNCTSHHGKLSRHFWSAGDYDSSCAMPVQGGMDHVRVHPKFLHSNATSHKWALGAIAELLDNAVDEVQNGATFVEVDKAINPRDQSPVLVFRDDGGGMDPEKIRQCMSFGYSHKTANSIGQYGNGFKTSTMRLGADAIVFTRFVRSGVSTQSIGLLSYTFLRESGHGDIVVPMVDYDLSAGQPEKLIRSTVQDWEACLKTILEWSPYPTVAQLLNQFHNIGAHGTKVVIFNLWLNDDSVLELDFDADPRDIQLRGGVFKHETEKEKPLLENHISYRLRFSLRAYASILYHRLPPNFQIILRGKVVKQYDVAADLKFPQYIAYKPQVPNGSIKEVSVVTTIGFTKEAPLLNIHGFNVYHKNRLIMPFWKVLHDRGSRGRGVVGVLEANFIEPAHDKQDFEKTSLLSRLETRLKQMTVEYWNLHCDRIGYHKRTKLIAGPDGLPPSSPQTANTVSAGTSGDVADAFPGNVENSGAITSKRKADAMDDLQRCSKALRQVPPDMEFQRIVEDNTRLQLRCTELQSRSRESERKYTELESKQARYAGLTIKYENKCKDYEEKCKELEARCSAYKERCEVLELEKSERQKKLDKVESELLETKNKYIMLLMAVEKRHVASFTRVKEERAN